MAVKTAAVAVSTAVQVSTTARDGVAHTVAVWPLDGTVYAGGADVTTGNGVPITPSTPTAFRVVASDALYLVAAAGAVNVRVMRTGADT